MGHRRTGPHGIWHGASDKLNPALAFENMRPISEMRGIETRRAIGHGLGASLLTVAVEERRLFCPLDVVSNIIIIQSGCCCWWWPASVRHGCSRQLPSLLGPVLAGDVAASSSPAGQPPPAAGSPPGPALASSADRLSQTIRRASQCRDGDAGAPTDAGLPGELLTLTPPPPPAMAMFSLDSVRRCDPPAPRRSRSLDADRCADVKRPRIDGRMRGPVRRVTGDPAGDEPPVAEAAAAAELVLTLLAFTTFCTSGSSTTVISCQVRRRRPSSTNKKQRRLSLRGQTGSVVVL